MLQDRTNSPLRARTRVAVSLLLGAALLLGPALVADAEFRRGDTNADGRVDVSDAPATLGYLFNGATAPTCFDAADADDNGVIELTDAIFSLNFLFQGGVEPPAPGPFDCGRDPTDVGDTLDCAQYDDCPAQVDGTVEDSLDALSIDRTETARLGDDGEPLPEEFDPLGGAFTFRQEEEIFLMGASLESVDSNGNASMTRVRGNGRSLRTLWGPGVGEAGWAARAYNGLLLARSVSGDIDGNGIPEIIAGSFVGEDLKVRVVDSNVLLEDGGPRRQHQVRSVASPTHLSMATGDITGDGRDEVVFAVATEDRVRLFVARVEVDGAEIISDTATIDSERNELFVSVEVEAGDLDQDGIDEIVILMNSGDTSVSRAQKADLQVYEILGDELRRSFSRSVSPMSGRDTISGFAIGNFDRDGWLEIATATVRDAQFGDESEVRVEILDDARSDFSVLRESTWLPIGLTVCNSSSTCAGPDCCLLRPDDHVLREIHVNAIDLDGSGREYLQVNELILGQREGVPTVFFRTDEFDFWDHDKVTVAVGDLFGDGAEEVLVLSGSRLQYWGFDGAGEFRGETVDFVSRPTFGALAPPSLAIGNFDGSVSEFRRKRFVFSQPIVNAVLAAPPCLDGGGQNTDACQTTFGISESNGGSTENSFTMTASAHFGVKKEVEIPVVGIDVFEAEMKTTLSATLGNSFSESYQLTRTIEYTAGPNEDAVICTVIPYDQYDYEVTAHANPELIGTEHTVSLPRDPITLIVEREYFNRAVARNASERIGDEVLFHQIGNPSSYPSEDEKDDLEDRFGGLSMNSAESVGIGGGSITLSLVFDEETTESYSWEVGIETEVSVTAGGVIAGFSVGAGAGQNISYSKGTSTMYAGTVGSLDPERAEEVYNVGLFTYSYRDQDGKREFEVINYWVED